MIIIGELINASRKAIKAAIEAQDAEAIQKVANDQAEAGADYIDVNAGIFVGKEPEYLKWLVETVQQATDKPCAIDSPDPAAIEAALGRSPGHAHDQLHLPGEGALRQAHADHRRHGHESDRPVHERCGHAPDRGRPHEDRRRAGERAAQEQR